MPAAVPIEVSESQQRELERIVKAKTSRQREVFRARIILGLARGLSHQEISEEQSVSLLAIGRWRKPGLREAWKGSKTPQEGGGKPGLSAKAVGRALSLARTQRRTAGPGACARWPAKPPEQIEHTASSPVSPPLHSHLFLLA